MEETQLAEIAKLKAHEEAEALEDSEGRVLIPTVAVERKISMKEMAVGMCLELLWSGCADGFMSFPSYPDAQGPLSPRWMLKWRRRNVWIGKTPFYLSRLNQKNLRTSQSTRYNMIAV